MIFFFLSLIIKGFESREVHTEEEKEDKKKMCKLFDFLEVWYQTVKVKFVPARFLTNYSYGCQIFFIFVFWYWILLPQVISRSKRRICISTILGILPEMTKCHIEEKRPLLTRSVLDLVSKEIFFLWRITRLGGQFNLNLKLIVYTINERYWNRRK